MKRSSRIQTINTKGKFISPIFFGFMGLVFFGFGLANHGSISGFMLALGGGFIVYALVIFRVNRKAFSAEAKDV
jgi:hypothetical protein